MTRDDMKRLIEDVRRNIALLDGCTGPHKFVASEVAPNTTLVVEYRCELCGGTVSSNSFRWYERGLAHGRRATSNAAAAGGTVASAGPERQ